jgi:hypothetical protein
MQTNPPKSVKILPWHRRQAIQIAAALPETSDDALLVLDLARQLGSVVI